MNDKSSTDPQSKQASKAASDNLEILLEQYKLAVEMAARMSAKRQDANNFYIGLVSAFAVLYSLLDREPQSFARSAWESFLPMIAVCWCVVWWLTIQHYRRLNMAKWNVIYKLEEGLPGGAPFTKEGNELKDLMKGKKEPTSPGSFAFTNFEAVIPILVGVIFLLLAARPLLDCLVAKH